MQELTDQQIQELARKLSEEQNKVRRAYLEQKKTLDDDMVVSGKTVKEWKDELWITVPSADMNPQVCIETNLAIMRAAAIVDYEHTKAEMREQVLAKQASSAYYQGMDHIVTEFKASDKRIPGAATLEVMAEVSSELYKRIAIEASNELKFWKNFKDHLQFVKKLMEQAGYAVGAEIRSEGYSRYLESLGKNYGGSNG